MVGVVTDESVRKTSGQPLYKTEENPFKSLNLDEDMIVYKACREIENDAFRFSVSIITPFRHTDAYIPHVVYGGNVGIYKL